MLDRLSVILLLSCLLSLGWILARRIGDDPAMRTSSISNTDLELALRGRTIPIDALSTSESTEARLTVLIVFSPSCPHCKTAIPVWRDWIARLSPSLQRSAIVIGNENDLAEFPLAINVSAMSSDHVGRALGLVATPLTLLINPSGEVLDAIAGVPSDDRLNRLQTKAASLPLGIRSPPQHLDKDGTNQ